ncbi:MAG: RagB/SusD family nutrient uptake outer membrane protein [Bacteroidota bacterium]
MKSNTKKYLKLSHYGLFKGNRFAGLFIFCSAILLTITSSCKKSFLDQKTLSIITEQSVFSDSLNTLNYVNSRYNNVDYSYEPNRFGAGGLEAACDEAESATAPTQYQNMISNGAANASNTDKNVWATTYQQVRAINIFLKNKATIPVTTAKKNMFEGQMRFLRAWYYATMLKHYGGFPNVGDQIFQEGDKIDIPRSTYADCVNYITTECDAAANLLPTVYPDPIDYGRATKGAALALKARVLLYAASPLTNASRPDDPDHLVSYGSADPNRWQLAAQAAQAVINLGTYSLYRASTPAFYQNFLVGLTNTSSNSEEVFAFLPPTTTPNNMFRETICNSASRGTRYTGTISVFPLQELVDAFGMQNGLPITDAASGYPGIGDNMYLNRDPRFYYTFSYNGSLRALSGYTGDQPVYTYTGVVPASSATNVTSAAKDGIYLNNATKTGYYCYKMLSDNVINGGAELNRPRMMIRYAEVLLNAAEASNEVNGPTTQVYNWLIDIRSRAGITAGTGNLYGLKAGMTKDQMRIVIQNERQVELAFEEHRFWDVRRWKIAPVTENKEMHGMEITRSATGTYSYRTIVIRSHVFLDNMYFWPIPSSEITKSPALKQNPGY